MNFKKLQESLVNKKYSQDGLVAWGQPLGKNKTSPYIAFSRVGDKLVLVPFSEEGIEFGKATAIGKTKISKAKVSGFGIFSSLHLLTIDGNKREYTVLQGNKSLKEIFNKFGL